MTVGIACPYCRYLIGVPDSGIRIVTAAEGEVAAVAELLIPVSCPECHGRWVSREEVAVIVPELVEGGKRRVNVK